jgi:hypothetical protein
MSARLVASRVLSLNEVGKLRQLAGSFAISPPVSLDDFVEDGKVAIMMFDHGSVGNGQHHVRFDYCRPSELAARVAQS